MNGKSKNDRSNLIERGVNPLSTRIDRQRLTAARQRRDRDDWRIEIAIEEQVKTDLFFLADFDRIDEYPTTCPPDIIEIYRVQLENDSILEEV